MISRRVSSGGVNSFYSRAQGTIEYLVIIAVVVVLSLIVVALFISVSSSPSQQISKSSSKIGEVAVGGISVIEAVSDFDGNGFVVFGNYSGEGFYLTKIKVEDDLYYYNDVFLSSTEEKVFDVKDLCVCGARETKKVCDFEFFYVSLSGLEKRESKSVTVNCSPNVRSGGGEGGRKGGPVEPILELGTLEHPWIISNCQELQDMNLHLDGNYKLGANIDCSDTINWGNGLGFSPIGTSPSKSFLGNFNGNSKTISNLFMRRISTNYNGLFGYSTGIISNVGLVDVNITGNSATGALVGLQNGGSISNSYSKGNIIAVNNTLYAGGLAGVAYASSISNSYSLVNITGYRYTGGLVGGVSGTTLSNSYSISVVSASSYFIGGLVGHQQLGSISNSYSMSAVTSLLNDVSSEAGGLVGYQESGNIFNSFSAGTISGENNIIGGLVGHQGGAAGIFKSYSITNVLGLNDANYIGGLVGYSNGDISDCYSAGSVTSSTNIIGGLVGVKDIKLISNSYWDITRTGNSNCCGLGTCTDCFGKNSSNSETDAFFPKAELGGDYNVPMQRNLIDGNNWTFGTDGNWTKRDNNYPILN